MALGISRHALGDILRFKMIAPDLPLPPVGFMVYQKLITLALGNNEYTLRLLPLAASVGALFLFRKFIQKYILQGYRWIPMALFAFSPPLIYYAAEVKRYSLDVFFGLWCLLLIPSLYTARRSWTQRMVGGIYGIIPLLFTYTAIFYLFSGGLVICLDALVKRKKQVLKDVIVMGAIWAGMFAVLYGLGMRQMVNTDILGSTTSGGYTYNAPMLSWQSWHWLASKFWDLFAYPLPIWAAVPGLVLFCVGAGYGLRKDDRNSYLLLPIVTVLVASMIIPFPIGQRFSLFLSPVVFLLISLGLLQVAKRPLRGRPVVYSLLIMLILVGPVTRSLHEVFCREEVEDSRKVVQQFHQLYRKGDSVLLNASARYAFGYYHALFDMPSDILLVGEIICRGGGAPDKIYYDVRYYVYDQNNFLKGKLKAEYSQSRLRKDLAWFEHNDRTWVLFIHADEPCREKTLRILDQKGERMASFSYKEAALYLYDLSEIGLQAECLARKKAIQYKPN